MTISLRISPIGGSLRRPRKAPAGNRSCAEDRKRTCALPLPARVFVVFRATPRAKRGSDLSITAVSSAACTAVIRVRSVSSAVEP
jgi:hypothetical protein